MGHFLLLGFLGSLRLATGSDGSLDPFLFSL